LQALPKPYSQAKIISMHVMGMQALWVGWFFGELTLATVPMVINN
jgi:hypothetical protein